MTRIMKGTLLMKPRNHLGLWICALSLLCLFLVPTIHAETISRYEPTGTKNDVKLNGTSNIHDWSAESRIIKGYVEIAEKQRSGLLNGNPPKTLSAPENLRADVTIPVKSLKSETVGLQEAIWKDMDCKEHPTIHYSFVKADLTRGNLVSGFTFDTEGRLTVNGITRPVKMNVTIKEPDADEIFVDCRVDLKMTDFNIKPPSLLAGLIKAGDKIHIRVHWALGRRKIN